ncbi:MAG: hypothetical protein H6719_30810 [Sandaracinaceae bacterium]|nr:hypothetical protein [Sandaracinaceae bacterium]
MSRADVLIAALALVCGLALGACLSTPCDYSGLDYSLTDTEYVARRFVVGTYSVDDDVRVRVDPAAETVTLSFTSEGRAMVARYDIVSFDRP